MFIQENEVQTLADLGLTQREASVFLALAKFGTLTARAITKALKMPRQDTYKVLTELQQVGLIEKQVSNPTKFIALPIRDACAILMNHKREKTIELQRKLEVLIRNFREISPTMAIDDEEPNLLLIPEREAFVIRIKKSIEAAAESIDVISPRNALQGLFYLSDSLQKAAERGAKIRFMIDDLKFVGPQLATLRACMENPRFNFKILPNHSATRFCIYDKKEITVVLSAVADFSKSSLLWSDCRSLVDNYLEHFEMLWLEATAPEWIAPEKT